MKEIILYLSENKQFVFETQEECEHYDSFGIITFKNLFLEVEDTKFALLEIVFNEKTQIIQAIFQSLTACGNELCYTNHDDLWKVSYNFMENIGSFKKKSGTYDSVYGDLDHEAANAEGWFPFWDDEYIDCYAPQPKSFSKEEFLSWVRMCLVNYYTAFGHSEKFRQSDVEDAADIRGLYGFLAVKMSKYKRRITDLEKKKEGLKEIQDKQEYSRAYDEIELLLDRNKAFVRFIEEMEDYL